MGKPKTIKTDKVNIPAKSMKVFGVYQLTKAHQQRYILSVWRNVNDAFKESIRLRETFQDNGYYVDWVQIH